MFDRLRIPGPARGAARFAGLLGGAARFVGLLGGVALTWACAAGGVMALIDSAFVTYRCPSTTTIAHLRILDVEVGISQHQIVENRCPTPGDLIREKYVHPRSLVDPWGTSIAYWCHGEDVEIRSAGPDKLFNTADDITNHP